MQRAGDVLEVSAKTALSVIPVGGALITSVWDSVKSNCAQQRLEDWQNIIEDRLSKIEKTLEEVGNNENFTTAIFHATEMAIKTAEQEKRNYLANAVVNTLTIDIDESIMMMFFNMIEKYTVMHIKILAYYQNPKKFIDTDCTNIIMGSAKDYLYQVYPQFKTSDSIVDKIINELYNDGLLGSNSTSLNTGMTMNGMLASRTKELGNSFIAFISNE